VLFGRDQLVEKIVGFAEHLTPVALVGAGGIGKTSTILTVLHDDRIKQRFGDERRFIRCDQFLATPTHFLRRFSEVVGAGIENPENLTPLRPFLSSKEMLIVLDNAESILGLQGTGAQEIYTIVEELSHFGNVCLCITSRISTIPPDCETLDIPTLSMEAARGTFYRIYKHGNHSGPVNDILAQLDFHPLSITLLATVAQHNKWDTGRLIREWETQRTGMLHTHHSKSLAATIELSLTSPMFQALGPDARALLGVVAFFPQGVDENNLSWLFPAVPNIANIFDTFCILSLTYRINGFITMLAPLRDYFCPQDPTSSPLIRATKDHYSHRLSVDVCPDKPGYQEAQWITSEDTNVEHLLDVFTSTDTESGDIWDTCAHFLEHLFEHKHRLVGLGLKIEGLSDSHSSKPRCLFQLSQLFGAVGHYAESKRLLSHTLEIWRERGDGRQVARTLLRLSEANLELHYYEEGEQLTKEALEAYEQLGDVVGQAECLGTLAWFMCCKQMAAIKEAAFRAMVDAPGGVLPNPIFDAAEEAASRAIFDAAEEAVFRAINLLPETGNEYLVTTFNSYLGTIYTFKDEREKAIHHYETAIGIASSFGWHSELPVLHYSLAPLLSAYGRFDDANAHVEQAKLYAANTPYNLGVSMFMQAGVWQQQSKFEEAKPEALRAAEVFEKLGAEQDLERCRDLLRAIDFSQKSASPLPLVNQVSMVPVSSWKKYYFLRMLIPFFFTLRGPNDTIDGCLDFFGRIPLRIVNTPFLYPVHHDVPQHNYYLIPFADLPYMLPRPAFSTYIS